jgi:DNA-directed RNA polymerase specialized sigma24 family protein
LALRYFDSMEYQTIASTLGLSLGNVKTLIHRGKIALTKKMRERERRAIGSLENSAPKGGSRALLLV